MVNNYESPQKRSERLYIEILEDMLASMPSNYDKREGSISYDTLAPAAIELNYINLDFKYFMSLLKTEGWAGEYLEVKVMDRANMKRKRAAKAIKKAQFSNADGSFFNIEIGSRFSKDGVYFIATSKIEDGLFRLECEQTGNIGNYVEGKILPVETIKGLATAEIVGTIEEGYEDETDESLLTRYLEFIKNPPTSGNRAHYKMWAKEVVGVGDANVIPLWAGNGTVKVVAINTNLEPISEQLINVVYKHIERKRPIGATLTVVAAREVGIKIKAKVVLINGYGMNKIINSFKIKLEEYRKETSFKSNYVSIAKIISLLLSVDGILDHIDLTLNNKIANIPLSEEEIPKFTIELEVLQ